MKCGFTGWSKKIPSVEEFVDNLKVSIQEITSAICIFLAGIVLYIPMITNRLNCSDGNLCGIIYRPHNDYDIEDIAGRYLIKYLAHMRSLFIFSWLSVLLGLLSLTFGVIIICRLLKIQKGWQIFLSGLLILFSPFVPETMSFNFVAGVYLCCFWINALAVYILAQKQTVIRLLVSSVMMMVAMAFYQAYLPVAISLFALVLLRDLMDDDREKKEYIRELLYFMISGVLAIVFYMGTNVLFKKIGLIFYQESRWNYAELLNPVVLFTAIKTAYLKFFQYFLTNANINNEWKARNLVNAVILFMGFVLFLRAFLREKRPVWKNISILILKALLPIAFMSIVVLTWVYGTVAIHMLPAPPLAYIGILAVLARESGEDTLFRKLYSWISYGAVSYVILIMGIYVAIYQLCMQYYADKTDSMGQRIVTMIEQEYPETQGGELGGSPVFICGDVDEGNYPQDYWIKQAGYIMSGTQATEGCFLNQMHTYNAGWNKYLAYNLGVEYSYIGTQKATEIYESQFYKDMALFPNPGCIAKTKDGIVVVKLKE